MADQTKTVSESLRYVFDFASETTVVGDTLASATTTAPTGLTLVSESVGVTDVTIVLSGGRHGVTYIIGCEGTRTGTGEVVEQTFSLLVDDYPSSVAT